MKLSESQRHRVIIKFFPVLRGHRLTGESLDGFYTEAVTRALKRGWSADEIQAAAHTGKWKKFAERAPVASPD